MELGINTDYEAEYVKIEEIEESIRLQREHLYRTGYCASE